MDTFIVFYLFVLHSVTCLKTCHFAACFTILWTSISVFYVKTTRDVVTVFLIFAKYLSLYLHIFICTYRGTHTHHSCTISTQEEWRQPGTASTLVPNPYNRLILSDSERTRIEHIRKGHLRHGHQQLAHKSQREHKPTTHKWMYYPHTSIEILFEILLKD